jgi:hypothetical protein
MQEEHLIRAGVRQNIHVMTIVKTRHRREEKVPNFQASREEKIKYPEFGHALTIVMTRHRGEENVQNLQERVKKTGTTLGLNPTSRRP